MTDYHQIPINAGELIERLEANRDEWLADAEKAERDVKPVSYVMARHIARGVEEAIEVVKEMAK